MPRNTAYAVKTQANKGDCREEAKRRLFEALCVVETPDEAALFLADLLTCREIEDLAQRLAVAQLLKDGASYAEVSQNTGASSTTVSRVSKCLNGLNGGYRLVLGRIRRTAAR